MIGIYIYFLGKDIYLHYPLIALKEVFSYYKGEVITKVITKVIKEWNISLKLRVYISDNVGNINTVVRALIREFLLNKLNSNVRRSRCLGYIINLAAKAFLLRDNYKAFKDKIEANKM